MFSDISVSDIGCAEKRKIGKNAHNNNYVYFPNFSIMCIIPKFATCRNKCKVKLTLTVVHK